MNTKAFTLIELLVVIAILAVLAVAVTLILNPAELIRQGRDSIRLSDLATINKALGLYQTDQIAKWMGTSTIVYTSLPDLDSTCSSYGLPSLPSGWTYNCETTTTYTNVDGTGWLPVDFTSMSFSSPLARLPLDPVNNATTSKYYTYVTGGSWELSAVMEAVSNKLGGDNDRVSGDGGDSYSYYELGSDVNLSPINDDGLVGYWQFDEGTGTTTADLSGYNNNGTITGASWSTSARVGDYALEFNAGEWDYVNVPNNSSLEAEELSVSAWFKTSADGNKTITGNSKAQSWDLSLIGGHILWFCGSSGESYTYGATGLNDGNWHFATGIREGSTCKIYVDGGSPSVRLDTEPLDWSSHLPTKVGTGGYGYFTGLIDDVRIYNRALSAAEVEAIYNSY